MSRERFRRATEGRHDGRCKASNKTSIRKNTWSFEKATNIPVNVQRMVASVRPVHYQSSEQSPLSPKVDLSAERGSIGLLDRATQSTRSPLHQESYTLGENVNTTIIVRSETSIEEDDQWSLVDGRLARLKNRGRGLGVIFFSFSSGIFPFL